MRRALYVTIVCLILAAAPQAIMAEGPAIRNLSGSVDTEIARFMRTQASRKAGGATAVTLAIGNADGLLLSRGYGTARHGVPATPQTRFAIASLSKQITAAAFMRTMENGQLYTRNGQLVTLDTDIRDIFAGVDHWTREEKSAIRVRNLLTMTSNLPNFTRRPPALIDPWGAVGAARLLVEVKRYHPHGWPDTFEYNNTGYFLLAEMLDQATPPVGSDSSRYERAILDILRRAGMADTHFKHTPQAATNLAMPNSARPLPAFAGGYWLKGSADLLSTADDFYRWNRAFMSGAAISDTARERMLSDAARVDPMTYYGMGWFIEHKADRDIYSHTGSVPGYTSANLIARCVNGTRWTAVTILTNGEEVEDLDRLAEDLATLAGVD